MLPRPRPLTAAALGRGRESSNPCTPACSRIQVYACNPCTPACSRHGIWHVAALLLFQLSFTSFPPLHLPCSAPLFHLSTSLSPLFHPTSRPQPLMSSKPLWFILNRDFSKVLARLWMVGGFELQLVQCGVFQKKQSFTTFCMM